MEQHKLYISESPVDVTRGNAILQTTCYSAIYQGSPLCAHRPDFDAAFAVAQKAADRTGESVWLWYGQAGRFSSCPIYSPRRRELKLEEREFLRLLSVYTNGSFNTFALSGSAKASCRAHCMSALRGKRVPQKDSGVTTLREELFRITDPDGDCLAAREESARAIAVQMLA